MKNSQRSTPSITTPPSTGWKIKSRTPSNSSQQPPSALASPIMESDQAFNRRLDQWAQSSTFRSMASHICSDVQKDMDRRLTNKQDDTSTIAITKQLPTPVSASSSPALPTGNNNSQTPPPSLARPKLEKRKSLLGDLGSFVFESPSILTDKEHAVWVNHGKDIHHHPHQWLKLASLFHIHPKTAHQRSLLYPATLQAAKIDRQVSNEVNRKPLESYLDLRRAQNRIYAQNAVADGVKLYENQKPSQALEYYKRALDMDPQYAEGYYRVAQSLLQEKRTKEAVNALKRALGVEPTHENAKSLLCTLENTTSAYTKDNYKKEKRPAKHDDDQDDEDDVDDKDKDDGERRARKRRRRSRSPSYYSSSSKRSSHHRSSRRRSPSPPSRKTKRSRRSMSPTNNTLLTNHTDRDRHHHRSSSSSNSKRDRDAHRSSRHHHLHRDNDDKDRYRKSRHSNSTTTSSKRSRRRHDDDDHDDHDDHHRHRHRDHDRDHRRHRHRSPSRDSTRQRRHHEHEHDTKKNPTSLKKEASRPQHPPAHSSSSSSISIKPTTTIKPTSPATSLVSFSSLSSLSSLSSRSPSPLPSSRSPPLPASSTKKD